jgi:hypothetical protein
MNKKIAIILVSVIIPVGLFLIFIQGLDGLAYEGNLVNHYYIAVPESFEIKEDLTIGQTFTAPVNGLQRIDVALRTYGRRNTHAVTFYLKQSPDSPQVIYQEIFNASQISDYPWRTFKFPPILDSAGKTFFFYFASPESVTGNAITVGGAQGDWYNGGTAYFGPVPTEADLAFRTYYGLAPSAELTLLAQRIIEAKPSIWSDFRFYLLLLVLYVLILLRVLVELIKLG